MAALERDDAVAVLVSAYGLDIAEAALLLTAAVDGLTGMAQHPRPGMKTVWVTHMTTLGGKFIIETEWPR